MYMYVHVPTCIHSFDLFICLSNQGRYISISLTVFVFVLYFVLSTLNSNLEYNGYSSMRFTIYSTDGICDLLHIPYKPNLITEPKLISKKLMC